MFRRPVRLLSLLFVLIAAVLTPLSDHPRGIDPARAEALARGQLLAQLAARGLAPGAAEALLRQATAAAGRPLGDPGAAATLVGTADASAVLLAGAAGSSTIPGGTAASAVSATGSGAGTAVSAAAPRGPGLLGVPGVQRARVLAAYGRLPLRFVANRGQFPLAVAFAARGTGYALSLTATGAVLALRAPGGRATGRGATWETVRLSLAGASLGARSVGLDRLQGSTNYLLGNDPRRWRTGVPGYARVAYRDVYPGVDLVWHGAAGRLEYDLVVRPGAGAGAIRLAVAGARSLRLDGRGALLLGLPGGVVRQARPVAYQGAGRARAAVAARYLLGGDGRVGLALGRYDHRRPLTIDPVLSFSTYLGGGGADRAYAIAVDSAGSAYVAGSTDNSPLISPPQFPTVNAFQSTPAGVDAFVTKFSPSGTSLVFSTFLGGTSTDDAYGLALDGSNNVYLTGDTASANFPTRNPIQANLHGSGNYDAFVTKLASSGDALVYSTYLGSLLNDAGYAIAVDSAGNAYVTGKAANGFPLASARQGTFGGGNFDAFVCKINAAGSALVYSTFHGGGGDDTGYGIAVDGAGSAYVVGSTDSTNFPTASAYQAASGGGADAFVSKFSPSGAALTYSTYLGGSGTDGAAAVALDGSGDAYVVGSTASTNFPVAVPLQPALAGGTDAFVTKLNAAGSALAYSTYLGGEANDDGYGVAVDGSGDAYVTGDTASAGFPVADPTQAARAGGAGTYDAFVASLNPTGSALGYATYLGGSADEDRGVTNVLPNGGAIAVDGAGSAYVAGNTASTDFPTANPYQAALAGTRRSPDAFVARLAPYSCAPGTPGTSSGDVPWHPHRRVRIDAAIGAVVDLADGHVDVTAADMALPARGPDLAVSHTYDSALAAACLGSSLGLGWQGETTRGMAGAPGSTVTYTDASGARWAFPYSGGAYRTPAGLPWSLAATAGGYTLTDILTSEALAFDAQGRITSDTDAYGNADSYAQSGAGAPTAETNSGGRALAMTYAGGLLGEVRSPLWTSGGAGQQGSRHTAYAYDGRLLTGLAWGAGTGDRQAASFGYSGALLTSVTTPMTLSGTLAVRRTWALGYDGSNRLVTITSPISGTVGQAGYSPAVVTRIQYSAGSTQVVEGYGSSAPLTATYTLSGAGEATAVADGLGHTTSFSYNADHQVASITDANTHTTTNQFQYIGVGGSIGLVTETDAPQIAPLYPGNTPQTPKVTYRYDPTTHDRLEQDDADGGSVRYTYDGHHGLATAARLVSATVAGSTTTYHWRGQIVTYDAYGERAAITDGRGVTVPDTTDLATAPSVTANGSAASYTRHFAYSALGDLTAAGTPPITSTLGSVTATAPVTTTYTFDTDGNRTARTSADGSSSYVGYDHLGRVSYTTAEPIPISNYAASATPHTTIAYDGDGNPAEARNGNEDVSDASYDPLGRPVDYTNAISGTTVLTYTATTLAAMRDPQGNVTTLAYDAAARLVRMADAAGEVQTYGYDNADNLTSVTVSDGTTAISVDTRAYNAANLLTGDTITGQNLAGALTTTYSTDLRGNVVRTQHPNGDVTFDSYDLAGGLVAREADTGAPNLPTGAHQETFAYDAAGNPQAHTDYRGAVATLTLDGDNRLTGRLDTLAGSPTITTAVTYDPDGNALGQSRSDGSAAHTASAAYNPADWPTSTTDDGLATGYVGDGAGRLQKQTIQGGAASSPIALDNLGRAISIGDGTAAATLAYDADNRLTALGEPGGAGESRAYDGAGRVTAVDTLASAYDFAYGYDAAGRTTGHSRAPHGGTPTTQALTHDAADRLLAATGGGAWATNGSWAYDGHDNLTSRTVGGTTYSYSYDPAHVNELASVAAAGTPTVSYGYDGNGDTTSIADTASLNRQLSYDAQGRLVQVTLGSPITETVALAYNAQGQRASYSVTPAGAGQPSLAEHFQYRNGDELAQVATTGTGVTVPYTDTYLYRQDGSPLELLRQQGGATARYWCETDGRANVVALADQSGHAVDTYQYDLWGAPTGVSETVPQRLRYGGYWYDAELGWYWLSVRSYDPVLERFLQPDPSELEGLFSYAYAGDDPVDAGDPSGLETCVYSPTAPDPRQARGTDCDDDAAGVNEDITPPENGVAIEGLAGAGRGPKVEAARAALSLCDVFRTPWGSVCSLADAVRLAIAHGGRLVLQLCDRSGACQLLKVVCTVSGICRDIQALLDDPNMLHKLLAFGDLALWIPGFDIAKGLELLAKLGVSVEDIARFIRAARAAGCAFCFPAGTPVATPAGSVPIERVRAGETVLAEDPATGRVEAARVVATMHHPASPLIAVDLSDGSSVEATPDHPFWVDGGPAGGGAGWVAAGRLRFGDRLRTADGRGASVVGVRYNVGRADVYTLTVATDHTFFVGSAQVLVHNAVCYVVPSYVRDAGSLVNWLRTVQNPASVATREQADEIVRLARQYGVDVRLDPPHLPNSRFPNQQWTVPHLNIGSNGQAHVAVPKGYALPS